MSKQNPDLGWYVYGGYQNICQGMCSLKKKTVTWRSNLYTIKRSHCKGTSQSFLVDYL